jgi:queuosine precursor transporter
MHDKAITSTPRQLSKRYTIKYYTPIAMLFVLCLLMANLLVQKVIAVGSFLLTAGDFIFPLVYLADGVLTEVYGYAASRRVIWFALFANVVMVLLIKFAILLPGAPVWQNQAQFVAILGRTQQIVFASFVAFIFGEFSNSYCLAKLKVFMRGNYLVGRAFTAMAIGQGIDTFIFGAIAFFHILSWHNIFILNASVYTFKIFYEIVLTPLVYVLVRFLKRSERIDVYDKGTNFNPFRISWI